MMLNDKSLKEWKLLVLGVVLGAIYLATGIVAVAVGAVMFLLAAGTYGTRAFLYWLERQMDKIHDWRNNHKS